MKGYYKRRSTSKHYIYATYYSCNHPLFNRCTLYKLGDLGLGVVQQRFNDTMKMTWWGPIDPWLANDIYEEPKFIETFYRLSGYVTNGLYPTIEVRKLMHALGMKPMRKDYFEKSIEELSSQ